MAEMVVSGVATRKVSNIMETLCGTTFSKSSVSDVCKDLLMITSDAHEGIQDAISKVFPDVPWQRCQFHFSKNISEKAPKKYQAGIRAELQEMWNCETIDAARKKRDAIIADYKDVAESAMMCLDEGFESAMTVMTLPKYLRKYFRMSNHIERLNKELKRRSSVIGIFPNGEVDLVSETDQNDIKYARKNKYDEAIFIEDGNTVVFHDIESGFTNRCPISDVCYLGIQNSY